MMGTLCKICNCFRIRKEISYLNNVVVLYIMLFIRHLFVILSFQSLSSNTVQISLAVFGDLSTTVFSKF